MSSQSGFFNLRALLAFALCSAAALLALASFATVSPTGGTLSPATPQITYTGGPFLVPTNSSDNAAGPVTCDSGANPCEDFNLTVDVPQSYKDTHPNDVVKIEISWTDPSGGQDLDTWLVNNPDVGAYPAHGTNGGDNPEVISLLLSAIPAGPHQYFVRVAPFVSTGQTYTGKISLVTPTAPPPPPPPPAVGPRYYNYSPGPGIGENSGEPSIGYNLITHKAMFIAGLQTLRVTFPDTGACEGLWEDVSNIITKTKSLDPILFTDQGTQRTFVSQLDSVVPPASPVLIGLNSFMAFTDDDGQNWTPAQINPPDGSYDHQSVGGGPYPAGLPLGLDPNYPNAVYYCSQAGVTAFCSRSDTGGLSFNRSVPIYNAVTDGCGGIHGHVKVAPDGTVYVPNRGCGGVQAITVSEDAGTTWVVRKVQGQNFSALPPPGILDPSLAIAADGTIYFSWISGEGNGGHAHVAVSHDKGVTWINDTDIGALQGVNNAVFIEAAAGDPDRAAIGFLGTTETGDHQADAFRGTWYAFIAHTYNGGQSWVTVNATPNAPVQREAGIWNQGGSSPLRNLLDFNEITKDEKGRVLYGFSDGCIEGCETGGPNSFSAKATIAKQSGGKGLLAAFDPVEPVVPQSACLTGRRDDIGSYLSWRVPDNGGAPIDIYKIFRSIPGDVFVQVGATPGGKSSFTDRSTDPAIATYRYKIVAHNSQGNGAESNPIDLSVTPRPPLTGACDLPGIQLVTDPTGDESDTIAQHDITSVSIAEVKDNETTGAATKIQFTIKIANLSTIPPGWRWSVRFGVPGYTPPPITVLGQTVPQEDWFVSMISSDGAAPAFTYGSTGVPQNAARFFTTIGTLDGASNVQPDGTITLVLLKSDLQSHAVCAGSCGPLIAGQAINMTLGSVRFSPPSEVPGAGGTNETIPDTTGGASYALRQANLCLPNTPPIAHLSVDVETGVAPLAVILNGSDSIDPDAIDNVASYTFNFGDGSDDVTQSSPTINHTFTKPGFYPVKLVVTDSRGLVSSNIDQHLVQVDTPLVRIDSRKAHGTAGSFDIKLPTTGTPGVECRSPGPANSHQIIYTFLRNLTSVDSATVPQGPAGIDPNTSGIGPAQNQYTVNLTGVTDAQHIQVKLDGVHDVGGAILDNVVARMDVLFGDVNGDGFVLSADYTATRQHSGASITDDDNFRFDVNTDGFILSGDYTTVRQKSGHQLP
jgi:PKD repeat protein